MARENPQAENLLVMAEHAEVEHAKLSQARSAYKKWMELISKQILVVNRPIKEEMARQLKLIDPDHEAIRVGDSLAMRRALRTLGFSGPLPIWLTEVDRTGKIKVICDDDRCISKDETLDMRETKNGRKR